MQKKNMVVVERYICPYVYVWSRIAVYQSSMLISILNHAHPHLVSRAILSDFSILGQISNRSIQLLIELVVVIYYPYIMLCISVSLQQVKLTSPDYIGCDKEEAVKDFLKRIECYKVTYVPLDDDKDR